MKLGLVSFTLVSLAAWTGTVYSTHGPVQGCCLTLSNTKVPVNLIVDYRNQSTANCKIAAVVFTKKVGRNVGRICADPNGKWTQKAMRKVNEHRLAALQENEGQAGRPSEAPTESPRPRRGRAAPGGNLGRRRRNGCKSRSNGRNCRRMRALPTEPTVEAENVF